MLLPAALLLSALFSLPYGLWLTHRPPGLARSVVKTLPVALLAAAALVILGPGYLVAALALGAAGDWFLSRPGERAFLAGLASFALGHLALVALYWPATFVPTLWAALPLGLALVMTPVLLPRAGALRAPVLAYIAIIALMGLAVLQPENGALAWRGALLFMVSDALLGISLFVLGDGDARGRILAPVVWFTYWGAQALFLLDQVRGAQAGLLLDRLAVGPITGPWLG